MLISDRFLPDRLVNSISQRYNRLCFLIYKANGIHIDDDGKLGAIPNHPKGLESVDEDAIAAIKRATPPTTMNVHRWTLEEDITLLKAVPVMGNLWAEICNRLMPHRDRGHIRKRYQVLERRIPKGVTKMILKRPSDRPIAPTKAAKQPKLTAPKSHLSEPPKKKPRAKKTSTAKNKVPALAPIPTKTTIKPVSIKSEPPEFEQSHSKRKIPPPKRISLQPKTTPQKFRPFSSESNTMQAAGIKKEEVEEGGRNAVPSPETRNLAALLEGFSSASHLHYASREHEYSHTGDNTQMGVEKILENGDSWSQASGMQRLLEIGTAESNFVKELTEAGSDHDGSYAQLQSPTKPSNLPLLLVDDAEASGLSIINDYNAMAKPDERHSTDGKPTAERKSILSSVMEKTKENALKRKASDVFPSTPIKSVDFTDVASPARENIFTDGFVPTSHPTSAISFSLGTPGQSGAFMNLSKSQLSVGEEFFQYFMSDKSRQTADPSQST